MVFGDVVRHELDVRVLEVSAVTEVVQGMLRVTLSGPDLEGFSAPGPADHVKVYFPDPATGVLTPPVRTPDGSIQRTSTAVSFNRDYTPAEYRPAPGGGELDIDFFVHEGGGLAADWARQARAGQRLAVLGPRGSRLPDAAAEQFVLIGDETALPAVARWLRALPAWSSARAAALGTGILRGGWCLRMNARTCG